MKLDIDKLAYAEACTEELQVIEQREVKFDGTTKHLQPMEKSRLEHAIM